MRYRVLGVVLLICGLFLVTSPLHVCHGCGGKTYTVNAAPVDSTSGPSSPSEYQALPGAAQEAFERALETGQITLSNPWDSAALGGLASVDHVRYEGEVYKVSIYTITESPKGTMMEPRWLSLAGAPFVALGVLWFLRPQRYPLDPRRTLAVPVAVAVTCGLFDAGVFLLQVPELGSIVTVGDSTIYMAYFGSLATAVPVISALRQRRLRHAAMGIIGIAIVGLVCLVLSPVPIILLLLGTLLSPVAVSWPIAVVLGYLLTSSLSDEDEEESSGLLAHGV